MFFDGFVQIHLLVVEISDWWRWWGIYTNFSVWIVKMRC